MAFGAVMDPRMKFVVIEYAYPMIYDGDEILQNIAYVRGLLYEMYEEYTTLFDKDIVEGVNASSNSNVASGSASTSTSTLSKKYSGWQDFSNYVSEKTSKKPVKSDLDLYLEDGLEITPSGGDFDVILWWKNNHLKYRILSRMAVDILAIPISTVASESTFSAGERVVDTYRSKLSIDTVQALICGTSWVRALYGLKGRIKEEEEDEEIEIGLSI